MDIKGLKFTHKSIRLMGGLGSGHHGHAGRPGSVGGSAAGTGMAGGALGRRGDKNKWVGEGKEQINEIQEIIQNNVEEGKYNYFGLRVYDDEINPETGKVIQETDFNVGETLPDSFLWLGMERGSSLGGTSVVGVRSASAKDIRAALKNLREYRGKQVVLVAGRLAKRGLDKGEIIIKSAEVLAVWDVEGR